ncbi:MAG: transcriptional repressor [Maricaulaceae bacterium]|nr:transcriptional repressor [Maricaulaceae bacterium]
MQSSDSLSSTLARAEKLCARHGWKLTPVRRRVLELLLAADGPVKAYDLLEGLKPGPGAAKPPTVYRALDFLMQAGLAHKVEALNAYIGCVHAAETGGVELYICANCGSVEERHGAPAPAKAPAGWAIDRSVVEHYGRCSACARLSA